MYVIPSEDHAVCLWITNWDINIFTCNIFPQQEANV